ncbi:Methyltransferase type 12 [Candidatus Sulfobium mesophilum]|uniref:Methyltransferase type 12 n=1 Tax=Candidatus Sulfobium mesophilum TaxID=2016548 RepID=A0A2U3QGN1_9BACT|nr:Methyltransferase type 12 [Candidatus Sulfobium mesophilum]
MTVFGLYSRYYDLLYRDKDYAGEAEHVHSLIQRHFPGAKTVLDLGCGTGGHDLTLAARGYSMTGIDMSEEMLAVANSQLSSLDPQQSTLDFFQGDIRTVRLGKTFDVVISLFHVVSYQTTNKDLTDAFVTARAHLAHGGIFIFDCWYGPAVLTDRPAVRVKRLEDDQLIVTRIAEPVMHPNDNVVDVNYHVFVRYKASGEVQELKETHRMRYLFLPEVELLLRETGMSIISASEWMTGREPGFDTWGVCFVVKG